MSLFVVRVWLPDRPGALGAVASRVGAVGADVVGIDILERGGGRAVDELTIELEDADHIDILTSEISQVDGVDVEYVRPARASMSARAIQALGLTVEIMCATTSADRLEVLVAGGHDLFDADWVAVIRPADGTCLAVSGNEDLPSMEWLSAFVVGAGSGSRPGEAAAVSVDGLTRVSLPSLEAEFVVSRDHLPLREAERQVLEKLAWALERTSSTR